MMKYIGELIIKNVDFYFALALIAIFGTASSLYLQFAQANTEFDTLNALMYSTVQSQKTMDDRESATLHHQLDQLENELDALNF